MSKPMVVRQPAMPASAPLPPAGGEGGSRSALMMGAATKLPYERVQSSPENARKIFDAQRIEELAQSIESHGLLQPIVVKRNGNEFEIAAGERRWRAVGLLRERHPGDPRWSQIAAVVTDGEAWEVGLIENLLRVDLGPVELALELDKLKRMGKRNVEIARVVQMSEPDVSRYVAIARLPDEILEEALARGASIAIWALFEIAAEGNPELQRQLWELLKQGYTLKQIRAVKAGATPGSATTRQPPALVSGLRTFSRKLEDWHQAGGTIGEAERAELVALRSRIDALLGPG